MGLLFVLCFSLADTKFAVKDVFEGAGYEFRVSAINLSGAGDPSIPCDTVIARDPMSKSVTPWVSFTKVLLCTSKGMWKLPLHMQTLGS